MTMESPSSEQLKRRVGRLMALLYFGYLGLAAYLYFLIRGPIWAYLATCAGAAAVMWLDFKAFFRRSSAS